MDKNSVGNFHVVRQNEHEGHSWASQVKINSIVPGVIETRWNNRNEGNLKQLKEGRLLDIIHSS